MPNPLHVEVAAALGWTDLKVEYDDVWCGIEPHGGRKLAVPPYHRSWCSIGVLLDRYNIAVGPVYTPTGAPSGEWVAKSGSGQNEISHYGSSACDAIAKLIVRLGKEGRLP